MTDESDLPPLDEELRALLRTEAQCPLPDAAVSEDLLRRLEGTLKLPAPLSDGGTGGSSDTGPADAGPLNPTPASPAGAMGAGAAATSAHTLGTTALAAKLLVVGALVASGMVAGAGMHAALRPAPEVRIVTRTVEVKVPVYLPAPEAPPIEAQAGEVATAESADAARPKLRGRAPDLDAQPRAERDRSLEQENALISRAQSALARRQPELAIAALAQHETSFASGQFVEEREALWVQALALSGKHEAAAQRAQRFKKRFPRSMLAPAVDAAVGGSR